MILSVHPRSGIPQYVTDSEGGWVHGLNDFGISSQSEGPLIIERGTGGCVS
jgi:hypothetical protein